MTVWKITGNADHKRHGNFTIVYAITANNAETPDVHEALKIATSGKLHWGRIDEVRRVGGLPIAWEPGRDIPDDLDGAIEAIKCLRSGEYT